MVNAELISIGDELLIGQVINTNVAAIAKKLGAIGIDTFRTTTVGDHPRVLLQALRRAWKEADVIIATGGLGPTHDDISKHIVAKFFGKKLHLDKRVLQNVKARFRKFGVKRMPDSNISQAMVPDAFVALRNDEGTAPGLWYEEKQKVFVLLPGVPHEMEWLMGKWVIPKLRKKYRRRTSAVILHKVLQTAGVGESALAEKIGDPATFLAKGVTLAFLPRIGGVRLRITAKAANTSTAKKALSAAERHIRSRIASSIYAEGEAPLEETIVALLEKQRATVSTAESCTAGMLATRITNVAGSSKVFPGGLITYANASKTRDLGVASTLLKKYGAVSEETAVAMAENIRKKFGTTYGVAITGIAGPGGGSKEKPVGTVWIGVAIKGRSTRTKLLRNPGDRRMVRKRSTEYALELLRQALTRS